MRKDPICYLGAQGPAGHILDRAQAPGRNISAENSETKGEGKGPGLPAPSPKQGLSGERAVLSQTVLEAGSPICCALLKS